MFERFTEGARRVVVLAQEEARLMEHDYIGTEHLLLGILSNEDDPVAEILTELGCGLSDARRSVERIVGVGDNPPESHIPFTPRAKKVLELSLREALRLGDDYIGTGHILLGLLREGQGVATHVITERGVDEGELTRRVVANLHSDESLHGGESLHGDDPDPLGRKRPGFRGQELKSVIDEMQRRIEALEIRLTALEDRTDP